MSVGCGVVFRKSWNAVNGDANESRNRKYKPGSISQAGGRGRRGTSMHYIARPVKRIDAAAASQGVVVSGVILPETGASFPAANHICQPVVFVAPFFAESSLLYSTPLYSTLLYSTLLYSTLFSSGMTQYAQLYWALVLVCQLALPRSVPIHCARLEKAADLAFLSFCRRDIIILHFAGASTSPRGIKHRQQQPTNQIDFPISLIYPRGDRLAAFRPRAENHAKLAAIK